MYENMLRARLSYVAPSADYRFARLCITVSEQYPTFRQDGSSVQVDVQATLANIGSF
jgi:hypothetical protein